MKHSHSQAGQDRFAWLTNFKKSDGTFVDIGCNDPVVHNNTYSLELLGWTGISVDVADFDYSSRKCKFVKADATHRISEVDDFLDRNGGRADYLSLDADDATVAAMKLLIPKFKFRSVTVEHDLYRVGPDTKNEIHDWLSKHGYCRLSENVLAPITPGMPWSGKPFEDWYVL